MVIIMTLESINYSYKLTYIVGEEIRAAVVASFRGRHLFSPFDVLRQERQGMTRRRYDYGDDGNDMTMTRWWHYDTTRICTTHDSHDKYRLGRDLT